MSNKQILGFTGDYSFLSNFYPCHIIDPSTKLLFLSAENLYQSRKFSEFGSKLHISTLTAGQAKRYGEKFSPEFSNWHDVKLWEMGKVVSAKFQQNGFLLERLLATENYQLIEANMWRDTFWGRCQCDKCFGSGTNFLGLILMGIRDTHLKVYTPLPFVF